MSHHDPFSPFVTIIAPVNIATAVNVGSDHAIASATANQDINVGQ